MKRPASPHPERRFDKSRLFADLGYRPHPGQRLVHESRAPRRVVACGVRFGKSLCAGAEGLAAAMAPAEYSLGWIVAPTYDLADRVFQQIVVLMSRTLTHRIISLREHEKRLILRNIAGGTSEIRCKSADNPTSLLGEGCDWIIADEAARLKASVWENHLSQRLIDKHGWAMLISTPKGKGYFYELYRRGQGLDSDYESWNLPSWANPMLDKDVIERERERLPERVFKQEFGAEFIEGAGSVFRNVRLCATGEFSEPAADENYVAGLDLAKVEDYTVLTIMDMQGRVVAMDRFHRIDWALQVQRIAACTQRYGGARTLVDSTGAGEPVFEALRRAGMWVEAYPFSSKSKTALIDNLSMKLEQRQITLPRVDLLPEATDELEAFEFSTTEAGSIKMGAPYGMHDDIVISLALAAWHLARPVEVPSFGTIGRGFYD